MHDDVQDTSHDSPRVVHAEVDLLGKLDRLELLRAENHVPARVLHVVSGHISELDLIRAGKDGLHGPLGQLAGVVLQLVGQYSTTLSVKFLAPINSAGEPRIPFVERLDVDELHFVVGALLNGVQLASADEGEIVAQVPLAVPLTSSFSTSPSCLISS